MAGDAGISDDQGDRGRLSLPYVYPDTLARLAVRITEAGPGCAQSLGLQGAGDRAG